ncbi:MAG TPA: enoyl-CoA hydratase-related protein [Polyangiaceae bacterium]|nr:enoyl-CoA hydratase-related protein [Polyangiaceae bacterium]
MLAARPIVPRSAARPGPERPDPGVSVEDFGAIRRVTLDRPSKKNAITASMYGALTQSLAEAASREGTHVVLLGSSGGAFSVGSDLDEVLESGPSEAGSEAFARAAGAFLYALASFPKPIVASVGGVALGVGASMLLHCDLVVAARTAAFEFPFSRLAGLPEGGASVLLCARVGLQRASEWLLCSDRIDAETALRFGLVNVVVHAEELERAALARAELLTTLPPRVVRETKRLLREPLRVAVEEAITRELDAITTRLPLMQPPTSSRR